MTEPRRKSRDLVFHYLLEAEASRAVEGEGGRVLGSVRHPFNSPDMSSFVLQAQASKAQVIGLANSSINAINSIKQAHAFGVAVVNKTKELPTDDPLFGTGRIRSDRRKIHDMYLFQVKTPAESKVPWDYYKLVGTVPAAEAFRPLADGGGHAGKLRSSAAVSELDRSW